MTARLPFNKRDRRRSTQDGLGFRPLNDWGSGDLPCPWAQGDIVNVPADAYCLSTHETDESVALARKYLGNDYIPGPRWWIPGPAVVAYACSIDEGDGWYMRLCNGKPGADWACSDRLHVVFARRTNRENRWTSDDDIDWMAGVELIDTTDPEGLALRERMLADGWSYPPPVEGWLPHG